MIVGDDMTLLVDDEARTLPLLRYSSIKKVVGDRGRGDVHDARQYMSVDAHVVLLFRVVGLVGARFRNVDRQIKLRQFAMRDRQVADAHEVLAGNDVPESADEQADQEQAAQCALTFHRTSLS